MNPLFTAVFGRDLRQVRAVVEQHPELLSQRFTTGELPIQLAASHPLYIEILVYLIGHGCPGSERYTDWEDLLETYVEHLSESHSCSSWRGGIEFILWCVIKGQPLPGEDTFCFANLLAEEIEGLRFLCEKSQHWPYWDCSEGRVRMAPLVRWQYMYEAWYAQQTAKPNTP
jgi:hypothetical protein